MTDLIGRTLNWLGQQLRGRLSMPGDERYAAAKAIWAKPVGRMPRAVVHSYQDCGECHGANLTGGVLGHPA